ncbi:hypothetical protein S550_003641, partial [Salmonella enterica subsp. enterica]|nr:hypothetical protein [Salmonella enterica subsp. enterica]
MGSNIIELAKLGHERAAELKASCGAVDVRILAQLISDLATQPEVQYVRAEESRREFRSADITMQNLEAKCEKLAAENAGLKGALNDILQPDAAVLERNHRVRALDAMETPATDAFLAEVRAQARNEGINYAAGRLAAAFNHGFVDKPLTEVCDVVRMVLDTKTDLANAPIPAADGLSGEYAEKALEDWAA